MDVGDNFNNETSVCSCGQEFTHRKNLYAHLRKQHKIEPMNSKAPKHIPCDMCDVSLSSQSSLVRHKRKIHNKHDFSNTGHVRKMRLSCPYETCSKEFLFYDNLREHFVEEHNIVLEWEDLTFGSIEDFEKWRDKMQRETLSKYTKDTGNKPLKSGVSKIFMNCHRSYSYQRRAKTIRATKAIGTNKIGKACPSRLEVTINESKNNKPTVSVKYWKTHWGHKLDTARLGFTIQIKPFEKPKEINQIQI